MGGIHPVVSVIIPTYNRCTLLGRAVGSALGQTLQDIEIIIADDGSTDDTASVFDCFHDQRVRYYLLPHRGACAARNAGLDMARGQYVAFLDSDDVWHPQKLDIQRHQVETSGADAVFCAFVRHDDSVVVRYPREDVPEGQISYRRLLGGNLVSTQTLFGRSDAMKQVRFDESFPRMQDWEYAIRLAQAFDLHYFQDALATVYVQPDSISRKPELGLCALRLLWRKYRREYVASMPDTLLLLSTMESFGAQCGQSAALDYLRALSILRPAGDNWCLARHSASLILRKALPTSHAIRREKP